MKKTHPIPEPAEAHSNSASPSTAAPERASDASEQGRWFDVRRSETVSIVAGNRVLYLGAGLTGVMIK